MGWLLNLNGFFPGQGLCKTATWTQVSPRIIPYHPVQRLRNPEPMDTWEGSGEVAIHALHPVGNIGGIWWIYSSLPWFNILGVYYSTLGGCVPPGTFTKAPGYVQFGPMDWNLNNARQKLVWPWPIFHPTSLDSNPCLLHLHARKGLNSRELPHSVHWLIIIFLLSGSRGIILHFPTQQQNGWYSSWVCGKLKNQVACSSHPKHAARRVHFGMSRTSQLLFHLLLTHSDPVQRHRGQPHIFSGWWF